MTDEQKAAVVNARCATALLRAFGSIIVKAVQFTGLNGNEIAAFMGCQYPYIENGSLIIGTLEGALKADPGDWIIKSVKGEFYPCKGNIFNETYEIVG